MGVYAIGCLHLGHENMAKMRGFNSSEEHDAHLIKSWNKVVGKKDKVFILGDITMETSKHYHKIGELNGYKEVILGNHDKPKDIPELLKWVDKVCGVVRYRGMWLSHIPVHPIEFDYRIRKNVHAHIHNLELNDPRYYKVDAAHVGYTPVSFDLIEQSQTI